jgi:hypothetical protein
MPRIAWRSFCAACGSESSSAFASSDSDHTMALAPASSDSSSTAADSARGMRQRCRRSTTGSSA